jgi:hypothetical protein
MLLLMHNHLPHTRVSLAGGASLVAVGNTAFSEERVTVADTATCWFDPNPAEIVTFHATQKQAKAA